MAKTLKLREDIHTDSDMKSILANFGAIKKEPLQELEECSGEDTTAHEGKTDGINTTSSSEDINTTSEEYTTVNESKVLNINTTGRVNTTNINGNINTTGEENTTVDKKIRSINTTGEINIPTPNGKINTTGEEYITDNESKKEKINATGRIGTPILVGNINTTGLEYTTREDDLIAQCGSITNYGYYCILRRIILKNSGVVRINAFCKQYKCDKKTLLSVIKRFEEKGLLYTISTGMNGRKLSLGGSTFTTSSEYTPILCSSSYLNEQPLLQSASRENATGSKYTPGEENTASVVTKNESTRGQDFLPLDVAPEFEKLPSLPSWEKARMVAQAEELFYIGTAARVDTGIFSVQTVTLYARIAKERGKDHAAALFLFLLPKAKDNPTGYISSACKQGAEPTSDSLAKVRKIWGLLDSLAKAPKSQEIKTRIADAMERDDMEGIALLTQTQIQIKEALHELSWSGTIDTLIEERDSFVTSLFGN
jgi:hypothetical protein